MICIVDYGMGNLRSVQKAFERVGAGAIISGERTDVETADALVLPGVGAFGDAMRNLRAANLVEPIMFSTEQGKPILGICLGMQLFFERSEERGAHEGLAILPGDVRLFPSADRGSGVSELTGHPLKVPHIGWNQIHKRQYTPLLQGVGDGAFAYFVHSYFVHPADPSLTLAETDYGFSYASVVGRDNLLGIQFHPEKSQRVGLQILANFAAICKSRTAAR